jgi:hypothetical protein
MEAVAQTRTAAELCAYLRRRRTNRGQDAIPEFEDFLKDVSQLFALRVASEEWWAGSPRGSGLGFEDHKYQAVSIREALPLEWNEIHAILVPAKDTPRSTLITYIAAHCIEEVRIISTGLRRVLSRERIMTPVGKVQQLDSYCMRWLMRQPGRDFAEKGGVQQRVMAVVRREQYDTLENRVFKDFLIRAENLASSYLDEIHQQFAAHPVYAAVKHFRTVCQSALALPEMDLISGLTAMPQPNYVLQQDNRYSKIWNAYCRIVRLAALAEKLWGRKDELKTKLVGLSEESIWQDVHKDDVRYHSRVWVNPLDGKQAFTERTVPHHDCVDESVRKKRDLKRSALSVVDGIGVVDLSGNHVPGDALCRGGFHPNARPRIHDETFPLLDDEQGAYRLVRDESLGPADDATRVLLASLVERVNDGKIQDAGGDDWKSAKEDLGDFCAQTFGIYRDSDPSLKEVVVLSPDDWNPVAQECVIRAFSMVNRSNVHLLWRSVATVLGFEDRLSPQVAENDVVAVLDFRNDGKVLVTGLKYLQGETPGRFIPQRGVFMRNGAINPERYAMFSAHDFGSIVGCPIVKGAKALCVTGAVPLSFWADMKSGCHYDVLEEDERVRTGMIVGDGGTPRCVLSDGERGWAQKRGAIKFCREHEERTLYYDELESMWVVGQTANEKIERHEIVRANDRFAGGTTQKISLPKGLMSIGEGLRAVKFLFHIGELHESTRLHEYKEDLPSLVVRTAIGLSGHIAVSPGQGIAVTTIESQVFKDPLVLDYLQNMSLSEWSIRRLEEAMPRSFPPTCAIVEAYPMSLGLFGVFAPIKTLAKVQECIKKYLDGKHTLAEVPDDAFAHAQLKKESDLRPGESRLHLLDRWNVFGNVENALRPAWLSGADEKHLIEEFVQGCKTAKFGNKCLRLLAWMYRGQDPKIRGVLNDTVEEYEAKDKTVAGLTPVQTSLLANCLSEDCVVDLERRAWRVLCIRLARKDANKGNDLRLFYNLLQFDTSIFHKLHISIETGCYVANALLQNLSEYRKSFESTNYKSCIRAFLYLLRLREKERYFLRPMKMLESMNLASTIKKHSADSYESAIVEFKTQFHKHESKDVRMLRDATLKFLQGEGTLDDIVTIAGGA